MAADDEEGGVDWRRLASDRNVSTDLARTMWQHAQASAPHDAIQAEQMFQNMLESAAAANVTHEPGRETLVDSKGTRDAGSLGPGKVTRVLEANPNSGPAGTAKAGPDALKRDIVAALDAGRAVIEMLARSDRATLLEALKGMGRGNEVPPAVQKAMETATKVVDRLLDAKAARDARDNDLGVPKKKKVPDEPKPDDAPDAPDGQEA